MLCPGSGVMMVRAVRIEIELLNPVVCSLQGKKRDCLVQVGVSGDSGTGELGTRCNLASTVRRVGIGEF